MSIFLLLLLLWMGALPALGVWLMDGASTSARTLVASLWALLPLLSQCFAAHQVLHPIWHRPGVAPAEDAPADADAAQQQTEGAERDAQAQASEDAFEAALQGEEGESQADDGVAMSALRPILRGARAGQLGAVVGGAVRFYAGRITDPRVDFGLPFVDVTIPCSEQWRMRHAHADTDDKPITAAGKRKVSDDRQRNCRIDAPPAVVTSASDVYHLRGWYIRGKSLGGCAPRTLVLLVHGAGRDRRTFMRHSPLFHAAGYSTLLIDCREHGTSSAQGRGVGYCSREAIDVIQAARFAREQLGYSKVVACGTSQGASSSIVAGVLADHIEFDPLPPDVRGGCSQPRRSLPVGDGASESTHHSRSRSRSRSYRHSTTRAGDASDSEGDEDVQLLDSSSTDALLPSTPTSTSSASSGVSASSGSFGSFVPHLIEGVIAENPFVSREACVSDILHRLLGRPPRILAPLLAPLQAVFVACIVLIVRYRLGLFAIGKVDTWAYNWRRAQGAHERVHQSLSRPTGAHVSPSSAHLPLPSLSSRSAPLSTQAGVLDLSPLDLVDRLAPRPLLLMHGQLDQIIAPVHSQVLFQHARDSKKLWLVADAHHTAIHDAAPEEWQRTVLDWLHEHGF